MKVEAVPRLSGAVGDLESSEILFVVLATQSSPDGERRAVICEPCPGEVCDPLRELVDWLDAALWLTLPSDALRDLGNVHSFGEKVDFFYDLGKGQKGTVTICLL